jgi:hypothetical protein
MLLPSVIVLQVAITSPVSVVRVNTYAQTLAEQLGFAFTRNETNFAVGGHNSGNMVGGNFLAI